MKKIIAVCLFISLIVTMSFAVSAQDDLISVVGYDANFNAPGAISAFDGNTDSFWQGGHELTEEFSHKWIQAEFAQAMSVTSVRIVFYDADHAGEDFEIWVSDSADFSSYEVLASVQGNDQGEVVLDNFTPKSGKYLRIDVTAGTTNNWYAPTINLVEIRGTEPGTQDTAPVESDSEQEQSTTPGDAGILMYLAGGAISALAIFKKRK